MIWEIINPSDYYTLEAEKFEVAAVAAVVLGGGAYGLHPAGGEGPGMPIMLFGENGWFQEQFGQSMEEVVVGVANDPALADCLESVLIGEREVYSEVVKYMNEAQRLKFKVYWHDQYRSSLNDIGRRAWALAAGLRGE